MANDEFAPVTPGEMLKEEFLAGYSLSQGRLARAIGISPNRISEIINNGDTLAPPRPRGQRGAPIATLRVRSR